MPEPRTRIVITTGGQPGMTMATIDEVEMPADVCRHCGEPVNEPPGTVNGHCILWHTETMQVHCADFQHQAQRADS